MTRFDRTLGIATLVAVAAALIVLAVTNGRVTNATDDQQALAIDTYRQNVQTWSERLPGCERGRTNYRLNREGWETAHVARVAAAHAATSPAERRPNRNAARAYSLIVTSFDTLARVDCLAVYPPPVPPAGVPVSRQVQLTVAQIQATERASLALQQRIRSASTGQ